MLLLLQGKPSQLTGGLSKEQWDNMRIYFIGFLLLFPLLLIAQYPPAGGDTSLVTADSIQLPPFQYKYFHPGNPGQIFVNADTTLGNFFQDADPARRKKFNDLNTGNGGSLFFTYFWIPAKLCGWS